MSMWVFVLATSCGGCAPQRVASRRLSRLTRPIVRAKMMALHNTIITAAAAVAAAAAAAAAAGGGGGGSVTGAVAAASVTADAV